MSHTVEDIKSFVTGMAIDVISCFEVKSRRRRNDNDDDAVSRRAFRLCVNAADRQRLLDPCRWPDSVAIYEWFFKASNPEHKGQNTIDKRQRLDESSTVDATLTAYHSQVDMNLSTSDDTIITETTSTTPANMDG